MTSNNCLIENIEDPLELFQKWYNEAVKNEINDPNAMSLATSTLQGVPSVRMVLLKDYSESGFVFYTNKNSKKGREISKNKAASICFHWKSLNKQVRIDGHIVEVNSALADDYFLSRSKLSQVSAVASEQSSILKDRKIFLNKIDKINKEYENKLIPRPLHWTGFCLIPKEIEFWLDQPFRAHDRKVFYKKDNRWESKKLYP